MRKWTVRAFWLVAVAVLTACGGGGGGGGGIGLAPGYAATPVAEAR